VPPRHSDFCGERSTPRKRRGSDGAAWKRERWEREGGRGCGVGRGICGGTSGDR